MEKWIKKNNKIVWFYCNPPAAGSDFHFTIQAESDGKTGRIVGQFSPFHSAIQAMLLEFNWTPTTHEGWGSYKKKKVFNISASSVLSQNLLTIRPLQERLAKTDKKHLFWVCSRITIWQSGDNSKKQICLQMAKKNFHTFMKSCYLQSPLWPRTLSIFCSHKMSTHLLQVVGVQ